LRHAGQNPSLAEVCSLRHDASERSSGHTHGGNHAHEPTSPRAHEPTSPRAHEPTFRPDLGFRAPGVSVLINVLLGAACSPWAPAEGPATFDNLVCDVRGTSAFTAPVGSGSRAGASATVLSIGAGPGSENSTRVMVMGAPDLLSGEADGQVFLKVINPTSGTVPFTLSPGTPTSADQVLVPPADCSTGGICNFGRTVLAVDIMECVVVDSTTLPPTTEGCGQELLVGAPSVGHGTSTGRVLIYRSETGPGVNGMLTLVGEVPVPAAASLGDEFGFAMAAQRTPGAVAWEVAPDYPAWVAISAPATSVPSTGATQEGALYIYAVDPVSSTPLGAAPIQVIDRGSWSGHGTDVRLGHAVAVGDFDSDGLADLVAGAPRPDPSKSDMNGNVWVHFGDGTTTGSGCTGPCVVSPLPFQRGGVSIDGGAFADPNRFDPPLPLVPPLAPDRFGAALSVGYVVDSDNSPSEALVVGAPEHDLGGSSLALPALAR